MNDTLLLQGLPPIVPDDARQAHTLIVGSMPSERSLATGQYYGHPQNHFWHIMGHLLDFDAHATYKTRCHYLRSAGLALWDVIGECKRVGSLDSAIEPNSIKPNPLMDLLTHNYNIRLIGCNGGMAYKLLHQYFPDLNDTHSIVKLLSSSPANARYSLDQKTDQWREQLKF